MLILHDVRFDLFIAVAIVLLIIADHLWRKRGRY